MFTWQLRPGDIAELIVFNRELSLWELNQLWGALGAKYGVALAPPAIQSISDQAGTASISFLVGPTTNFYYLQASDSLAPGTWINIGRLAGSLTVSDAVLVDPSTNSLQRFYRLLLGP